MKSTDDILEEYYFKKFGIERRIDKITCWFGNQCIFKTKSIFKTIRITIIIGSNWIGKSKGNTCKNIERK